jgi:hypothetical protein
VSLADFLRRVVEALDAAGVPYMLTGSLAAAFYAVPRATQDIDLVIETEERQVGELVQSLLSAGWYVDRDAALEALRLRGQFNAIEPETGWKADFIVRKERPYSREEFRRRRRISLLGLELSIASLEDIVIAKLEWGQLGDSALQRRDVVQLIERTWPELDQGYLERWIGELNLESEWRVAVSRAGRSPASEA